MGLSTAPRASQGVLVSRRSASRPSCARRSGRCASRERVVGRADGARPCHRVTHVAALTSRSMWLSRDTVAEADLPV